MASPDLPFVDIPASDRLTVRLELLPRGPVALSVFYDRDPTHTLGTNGVFKWDIGADMVLWTA